ncbi:SpoIIE family protein phosphatase [Cryptosporangium arvum]|uniref:protein-serine/threonine phosphatase n=1 Tax=Cryptosporangium arvum DSM 44712 TaxID=927661 RepID=A0A010ZNN9_9ACTN|nr:SpoIIE family protein phosphatase [Cryptosporangium arvum]EXG80289.1 PAS domain S-box [Cryptosporangium arvum DSM 44712]
MESPESAGLPTERSPDLLLGRLELALDASGIGSFDWHLATDELIWDDRLCRLFGVDPDTFGRRIASFYDGLHPADRIRVRALIERAIDEVGEYRAEYRVLRPDGETRWVEARGRVFADADGRPERLIGVATDFTDRHQAWQRQQDAARAEWERAALMTAVTRALAEALTLKDVTQVLTGTLRGAIGASALGVVLMEADRLRVVDAVGYDPLVVADFDGVALTDPRPLAEAVRTRAPLFAGDAEQFAARWPGAAEVGGSAWAYLPMIASGRPVGGFAVRWDKPQPFTSDDRTLLVALGGLAAQSFERARLYDAEHELAAGLQRVMLPRRTDGIRGVSTACRYLPSTDGLQVGGDWYDVIALPSGHIGLVVGDVEGHTAHAAAVMGQLRIGVRAYAAEGHRPEEVMARTNRLLVDLETRLLATCCYVTLDPATGDGVVVRAGHPPPLVVRANGGVELVESAGGLILGVQDAEYRTMAIHIGPGDALVLVTDGLIETPGLTIDAGLRSLAELAAAGAGESAEHLADRIVAPVGPAGHRFDDVAVVVARRDLGDESRIDEARHAIVRGAQGAIGRSRAFVGRTLTRWGFGEIVVEQAVLCASELVTNAIRHGEGLVELALIRYPDRVRLVVEDDSPRPPRVVKAPATSTGGRGLDVVERLSVAWGSEARGTGKIVWAEFTM